METTVVLIPFPAPGTDSDCTEWSIARVVVRSDDVAALRESLAILGVSYYPAGTEGESARGLLLPDRYEGDWLSLVRTFVTDRVGQLEIIAHDDYDASWRLPPEPTPIGPACRVVSPWSSSSSTSSSSNGGERDIILNPGLAFGDCKHPTTRLCATKLTELVQRSPIASLLDVGCGSGILFLVAARLGVKDLAATDISAYCRYVARLNASRNGVSISMSQEIPSGPFDVVVANVWATAFPSLAEPLCKSMTPGGSLLLSGFPLEQADEVAALFPNMVCTRLEDSGWGALLLRATDAAGPELGAGPSR
jgi:ribosomal protein L11 methylase PrmA